MQRDLTIRQERPGDAQKVYEVVKRAFAGAEHTDGGEQDLVVRLRKSRAYLPELALVAETEGKIAGYILFTKISIGERVELALAPLAVAPEYQRRGIGGALILEGHRIAKELGYEYCVVLGSAAYYPRFGYRPACTFGILPPFEAPRENFMARNLQGRETPCPGTVAYAPEFFV